MLENREILLTKNKFKINNYESSDYTNELTREMDNHLHRELKDLNNPALKTYIYNYKSYKNIMILRFPGATRGQIEIDDNLVITKIIIYEKDCGKGGIYDYTITEAIKPFIGRKIEFE